MRYPSKISRITNASRSPARVLSRGPGWSIGRTSWLRPALPGRPSVRRNPRRWSEPREPGQEGPGRRRSDVDPASGATDFADRCSFAYYPRQLGLLSRPLVAKVDFASMPAKVSVTLRVSRGAVSSHSMIFGFRGSDDPLSRIQREHDEVALGNRVWQDFQQHHFRDFGSFVLRKP